MNKILVWVGLPVGMGILLLVVVFMNSEAGADTKYKTVKSMITGQDAQIAFRDKKPGTGATVKDKDTLKINLSVRIGGMGQPAKMDIYSVGSKRFGPGFDEGLVGMKVKGAREITVPPELMMMQAAKDLPPGDIVFDVELIEILPFNPHQGEDLP